MYNDVKLKPCPFCRSDDIIVRLGFDLFSFFDWTVGCRTENCYGKLNKEIRFSTKSEAIQAWNRYNDDIMKGNYQAQSTWFGKLINSLSPLNKITRTKSLAYICRNKKHNADGIVVKFNKKHWIIIRDDGTWDHIRSHGHSTVDKIRKGIL